MSQAAAPVSLAQAVRRGLFCRCPHCGKGRLFGKFVKVASHCDACGEEFHHHRADDFPAYIVMMIVGHIIVPAILALETAYAPDYWVHFVIWLPLTAIGCLGLLQPVKGAIVGLQWQIGMHGFEYAKQQRAALTAPQLPPA